jgi:hypothetical protein
LYVAYIIPVMLGLRTSGWRKEAVWSLGRWGPLLNWIAVIYVSVMCIILVMPPNELAGITFVGLVAILVLLYRWGGRHRNLV